MRRSVESGYLPYILLPKFDNVVTTIDRKGDNYIIPHDVYVGHDGIIHFSAASSFIHNVYMKSTFELVEEDKRQYAVISDLEATTMAFVPTIGEYRYFGEKTMRNIIGHKIEVKSRDPSDFDINMIARRLARLESGAILASIIKRDLGKAGWSFEKIRSGMYEIILTTSQGVRSRYEMKINIFRVSNGSIEFLVPGVIPALLVIYSDPDLGFIKDGSVRLKVRDTINSLIEVGRSVSDIAILQNTTSGGYNYVIGEVSNKDRLRRIRGDRLIYITSMRLYKGIAGHIFVNRDTGVVLLSVKQYITSPPANIVMSYPPLYLAPLIGVLNSSMSSLKGLVKTGEREARRRFGLELNTYIDELDPLMESRITLKDINRMRREGYPSLQSIEHTLKEIEKLGDISDIISMTYSVSNMPKLSRYLLTTSRPVERKQTERRKLETIKL